MNQIEEDYFVPGKTNLRQHTNFLKRFVKRKKNKEVQYSDEEAE